MKVLLQSRMDLLNRHGGDTARVLELSKKLKQYGIYSDINKKISKKTDYDLIHFFGIMRISDFYSIFRLVKKHNIPVVVTPILESLRSLDANGRIGIEKIGAEILSTDIKEFIKKIIRRLSNPKENLDVFSLFTPYTIQQKQILRYATYILATSQEEKKELMNIENTLEEKIIVVPYGIDIENTRGEKELFIDKYGIKNFILSVGRIEPKKNQVGILKALNNSLLTIIFIGGLNNYHKGYIREFFSTIKNSPNTKYIGKVSREMLLSAYAAAKVHVLGSWFELPGIVSFEAALNNCNIVTTDLGCAREYFGKYVLYCNPNDPLSIKRSILKAYKMPFNKSLKHMILKKYTIDQIIPLICNIYNNTLNRK